MSHALEYPPLFVTSKLVLKQMYTARVRNPTNPNMAAAMRMIRGLAVVPRACGVGGGGGVHALATSAPEAEATSLVRRVVQEAPGGLIVLLELNRPGS